MVFSVLRIILIFFQDQRRWTSATRESPKSPDEEVAGASGVNLRSDAEVPGPSGTQSFRSSAQLVAGRS